MILLDNSVHVSSIRSADIGHKIKKMFEKQRLMLNYLFVLL